MLSFARVFRFWLSTPGAAGGAKASFGGAASSRSQAFARECFNAAKTTH